MVVVHVPTQIRGVCFFASVIVGQVFQQKKERQSGNFASRIAPEKEREKGVYASGIFFFLLVVIQK
jgi:hypothetical protein